MSTCPDWVVVGRFGRVHGVKGFVSVVSFTDPRDNIMHYPNWHVRINNQWQPIQLQQTQMNHKALVTQVVGYDTREDVARLTNMDIAIRRRELPMLEPGEYYWHQLVGMTVIDLQGDELGVVSEIMSTGAHDVLVVVGERRRLIPYLPGRTLHQVNEEERTLIMDWDKDF